MEWPETGEDAGQQGSAGWEPAPNQAGKRKMKLNDDMKITQEKRRAVLGGTRGQVSCICCMHCSQVLI